MRDFLDVVNDFPRDVLAKARSSMPFISLSLPKSDNAKPHDRFDSRAVAEARALPERRPSPER
jgi:hypothetical protein